MSGQYSCNITLCRSVSQIDLKNCLILEPRIYHLNGELKLHFKLKKIDLIDLILQQVVFIWFEFLNILTYVDLVYYVIPMASLFFRIITF